MSAGCPRVAAVAVSGVAAGAKPTIIALDHESKATASTGCWAVVDDLRSDSSAPIWWSV